MENSGGRAERMWLLLESPFFLMAAALLVTVLSIFTATLLFVAWGFFVAAFYRSGLFAAGKRKVGVAATLAASAVLLGTYRVLPQDRRSVPAYVCASRIAPLNGRGTHGTLVEFGMAEGATSGFLASVRGIPWTDVDLGWQFGAWWASPLRTDLPANHQPVTGSGLMAIGDGSITRTLPPPANISPARSLYFYFETTEPFPEPVFRFIQNFEMRDEPNADALFGQFGPCPRNRG